MVHVIDCDAEPKVPRERAGRWIVYNHHGSGEFQSDDEHLDLMPIVRKRGEILLKLFDIKAALPANVLDYWLEHPEAIPEKCNALRKSGKPFRIFFATTYMNEEIFLLCRFIHCEAGKLSVGIAYADGMGWDDETTDKLGFTRPQPELEFLAMRADTSAASAVAA